MFWSYLINCFDWFLSYVLITSHLTICFDHILSYALITPFLYFDHILSYVLITSYHMFWSHIIICFYQILSYDHILSYILIIHRHFHHCPNLIWKDLLTSLCKGQSPTPDHHITVTLIIFLSYHLNHDHPMSGSWEVRTSACGQGDHHGSSQH